MIINKDLIEYVLTKEITNFSIVGNTIYYTIDNYETEEDGETIFIELEQKINLYEFAWRVKYWAFSLGYRVETKMVCSVLRTRESSSKILDECHNGNFGNGVPYDPLCDIKVCEWILENDERFINA
jgi:hypothetical protein